MAHFLLVHGAGHGAWAWDLVLPNLATLGHSADALDLPSHGASTIAPEGVTLDDYAQAILSEITGPTVLVGHSMGGYPITRAAQINPEHITRLVYLCAYTPWPDLTLADMRRLVDEQPLVPAIRKSTDGKTMRFDPAMAPDLFYHDCPRDVTDRALARLCAQPIAPMETVLPDEAKVTVPRSYITCTDDRAIPPELQTLMAARLPAKDRHSLATSHSPFLSEPLGLARLLDRIASAA